MTKLSGNCSYTGKNVARKDCRVPDVMDGTCMLRPSASSIANFLQAWRNQEQFRSIGLHGASLRFPIIS